MLIRNIVAIEESSQYTIVVDEPALYRSDDFVAIPDNEINAVLVALDEVVSFLGEVTFRAENVDSVQILSQPDLSVINVSAVLALNSKTPILVYTHAHTHTHTHTHTPFKPFYPC